MDEFARREGERIASELNAGNTEAATRMLQENFSHLAGNPQEFMNIVAKAQHHESRFPGTADLVVTPLANGFTDVSVVGPQHDQWGRLVVDPYGREILQRQDAVTVPPPAGYVVEAPPPPPGVVVERPAPNPWATVVGDLIITGGLLGAAALSRPRVIEHHTTIIEEHGHEHERLEHERIEHERLEHERLERERHEHRR